jgi:hypothetical protein
MALLDGLSRRTARERVDPNNSWREAARPPCQILEHS